MGLYTILLLLPQSICDGGLTLARQKFVQQPVKVVRGGFTLQWQRCGTAFTKAWFRQRIIVLLLLLLLLLIPRIDFVTKGNRSAFVIVGGRRSHVGG